MHIGKLGRALFKIGYYRHLVEGPSRLGVVRNWFGKGKIVGVFGGGVPPVSNQKALLETLKSEHTPVAGKRAILQNLAAGKISFSEELREQAEQILNGLSSHPELKELIQTIIKPKTLDSDSMHQILREVGEAAAKGQIPSGEPLPKPEEIRAALEKDRAAADEVISLDLSSVSSTSIVGGKEGEIDFNLPELGGLTSKGGRKNNEDALLIARDGGILIAVADGMGGHQKGAEASQKAIETIENIYLNSSNLDLMEIFRKANQAVSKAAENDIGGKRGTTLVSALITGDTAQIASVGDSRAYLIRDGEIRQLTPEDSYAYLYFLEERGKNVQTPMNPQQTEDFYTYSREINNNHESPLGHRITQALGLRGEIEPVSTEITLKNRDLLILVSDGLFCLEFQELKDIIEKNKSRPALEIARALEQAAAAKADDNITIAVYRHEKEEIVEVSPSQIISIEEGGLRERPPAIEQPTAIKEIDEWVTLIDLLLKYSPLPEAKRNELIAALKVDPKTATPESLKGALHTLRSVFPQLYLRAIKEIDEKNTAIQEMEKNLAELETTLQSTPTDEEKTKAYELQPSLEKGRDEMTAAATVLTERIKGLLQQKETLGETLKEKEKNLKDRKALLANLRRIDQEQRKPYEELLQKTSSEIERAIIREKMKLDGFDSRDVWFAMQEETLINIEKEITSLQNQVQKIEKEISSVRGEVRNLVEKIKENIISLNSLISYLAKYL